jgi:hypothetical protein
LVFTDDEGNNHDLSHLALRDAVVEAARVWRAEKWNIFQAQRLDAAVSALERAEKGE